MRSRAELAGVVERLRGPLREFVRESRIRVALVVNGSGQVLAQHGFTGSYEVVSIAALAAAAHSAARALGEISGAGGWRHMYNQGRRQQLFLSPVSTPAEELIVVAIFDGETSLGLVRLFCDRFAERLAAVPDLQTRGGVRDARQFESELEAGLRSVFDSESEGGD